MIDLHCHSTVSDGEFPPSQLPKMAELNGVTALALTDHDTTDGLEELMATDSPVERIPGVELSCTLQKCVKIHIVGLFVDWRNPELQRTLADIRRWRDERNVAIIARLKEMGMPLDFDEVQAIADENNGNGVQNVVGRPHIAAALCRHGYCKNVKEAFEKYLRNDRPAYVHRQTLDAKDGINLLHEAGASVFWAHPFKTFSKHNKVANAIKQLMFFGLDGLETIYSEYKPADVKYGHELAKNRRLLESGGSDFHGPRTSGNIQIGIGHPEQPICVPEEFLQAIKEARSRVL